MTMLEDVARAARQYERGYLTAEEFAKKLADIFASDTELRTDVAADLVAIIPAAARQLVIDRIALALSSGYVRQAFALGGTRTKEEEHLAALRETAREKKWAEALRPLFY
jgi:hypothetical protein